MPAESVNLSRPVELARVSDLTIDFRSESGWSNVLDGVDIVIRAGEAVGLVGESGCGKTTTAFSLLGYRRPGSRIVRGSASFLGRDLYRTGRRGLERIRGREIGFVPQNPTATLNPRMRIGDQIEETVRRHGIASSRAARRARMRDLLVRVGLPPSARPGPDHAFPHQLSGGQQQRVMIALALACDPKLVVLDEPTTGLDVTTQAQILDLLGELRSELDMALVYVTHDLGVIAEVCDRVYVMYAGHVVEEAPTEELFERPRHPYTRGLLAAVPSLGAGGPGRSRPLRGLLKRDELPQGCRFAPRCPFATPRCFEERQVLRSDGTDQAVACWRVDEIPALEAEAEAADDELLVSEVGDAILDVSDLDCAYGVDRRLPFMAARSPKLVVQDVSFGIRQGETLALVGESGSGKSTIARFVAGLHVPVDGSVRYDGQPIAWAVRQRSKDVLRQVQLVLQNPDASLNPRRRVGQIVGRPLELFYGLRAEARSARVAQLLEDVRLDAHFARRYPDELSGGERQRVAIARALAAEPRLVLCDEILSALDVSVQAEILDLMRRLQARDHMAYLFISHDLAVVRSIAHRVAVLYRGQLCEVGSTEEVFAPPSHPYTSMLLSSVPGASIQPGGQRPKSASPVTTGDDETPGCPFSSRCPLSLGSVCEAQAPPWQKVSETHAIRCHVPAAELRAHAQQPSVGDAGLPGSPIAVSRERGR